MKLDDYRTSDNVRDAGQGLGGGGFGGGGGMGGGLGLILSLVASRFGIGGIAVVLIGAWMLGMFGGGGSGVVSPSQPGGSGAIENAAEACATTPEKRFSCQVLATTEDTWAKIFEASGQRYQPAGFTFFTGGTNSGCGAAQSAMGPFYCPSDNRIYIDTSFYGELQTRFGAAGDFAQAYVIAHEVGHHVQQLEGTLEGARRAQASSSRAAGNAVQVQVELQADCYAGVWAANNRNLLSPGDVEEGLRAAAAIGDDTLQKATQGRVVPESFTHGTSAQRTAALKTGLQSGNPADCTFR